LLDALVQSLAAFVNIGRLTEFLDFGLDDHHFLLTFRYR